MIYRYTYRYPRIGDSVWKEGIGTGTIVEINEDNDEIVINFPGNDFHEMDLELITNTWTDRHGGTYMLYDEGEPIVEDEP